MEKFFNEDELSVHMKEVIGDGRNPASDRSADECCRIAESMIEEIHQIALPAMTVVISSSRGRSKGSFRKRLLRQIRAARKLAAI
jgi:hypothetical protein